MNDFHDDGFNRSCLSLKNSHTALLKYVGDQRCVQRLTAEVCMEQDIMAISDKYPHFHNWNVRFKTFIKSLSEFFLHLYIKLALYDFKSQFK